MSMTSHAVVATALGPLRLTASDRGLRSIEFAADDAPLIAAQPGTLLDRAAAQLRAYLAGKRAAFDLPLDLDDVAPFTRRVLDALSQVPYGQTTTYAALAAAAGSPRASRAAGSAMRRNHLPIVLPCHRVLPADGQLGSYAGGVARKRALLEREGSLAA